MRILTVLLDVQLLIFGLCQSVDDFYQPLISMHRNQTQQRVRLEQGEKRFLVYSTDFAPHNASTFVSLLILDLFPIENYSAQTGEIRQ